MKIVVLLLLPLVVFAGPARANPAVDWAERVQSDPNQPAVKKEFAKVVVMMDEPPTGWTFKFLPGGGCDIPYGGAAADVRYPIGTVFYIPPPIDGIRVVVMHAKARLGRTLFLPEVTREGILKGVVPLGMAEEGRMLDILRLFIPRRQADPEDEEAAVA